MSRWVERIAIAAGAAALTFAVATGTGEGGSQQLNFNIPRGGAALFLGTTTTCVNPKGQITGGQVACTVHYTRPRSANQIVPPKYDIGLTLRCLDFSKWSRRSSMMKSGHFC